MPPSNLESGGFLDALDALHALIARRDAARAAALRATDAQFAAEIAAAHARLEALRPTVQHIRKA